MTDCSFNVMYMHILQCEGQLHWRQRNTGSGRESDSQPLATEPEVRTELCMSFSGESEGEEEGGGRGGITFHILIFHGTQILTTEPGT